MTYLPLILSGLSIVLSVGAIRYVYLYRLGDSRLGPRIPRRQRLPRPSKDGSTGPLDRQAVGTR